MSNNVIPDEFNNNPHSDFGLNVQRGLVDGVSVTHKTGTVNGISSIDGFVDICGTGEDVYTGFSATVAEQVLITSTSGDDALLGPGANAVFIRGLNGSLEYQEEIVNMNGVTGALSVNSYLRLDLCFVVSGGASGVNVGDITVKQSITTANIFVVVDAGTNRSLNMCYTVPFGKIGYVDSFYANILKKGASSAIVKFAFRPDGGVFQEVEQISLNSQGSGYISRDLTAPLLGVGAGTDIKAYADVETNDTGISTGFIIKLVDTE